MMQLKNIGNDIETTPKTLSKNLNDINTTLNKIQNAFVDNYWQESVDVLKPVIKFKAKQLNREFNQTQVDNLANLTANVNQVIQLVNHYQIYPAPDYEPFQQVNFKLSETLLLGNQYVSTWNNIFKTITDLINTMCETLNENGLEVKE